MGGARLYRSQTARVNAPVRPLIASGPQFHLLVRGANPEPVRVRTGPGSWPIRDLCRHTVRQIAHNVDEIQGVRNSIDLFCHKNILSWKDMCDEERRGEKLNE